MDPNETLKRIRERIADFGGETSDDAFYLGEDISALDNWLCNGGFLPTDWNWNR